MDSRWKRKALSRWPFVHYVIIIIIIIIITVQSSIMHNHETSSREWAANIVRRPCSDSSHITAPYKLSFYYYCIIIIIITANQADAKSNLNPSTKQHAIVSTELNIVQLHVLYVSRENSYKTLLLHRFYYFPLLLNLSHNNDN